jgi:hypothetical protein
LSCLGCTFDGFLCFILNCPFLLPKLLSSTPTAGCEYSYLHPGECGFRVGSIYDVCIYSMHVASRPSPTITPHYRSLVRSSQFAIAHCSPLPHIPLDNLITRSIPNTILPPPPSNHPLDMRYRLRNRPFSVPLE